MIRIYAEKELRFTGYGVRLMPGENELPDRVPYGLRKSLQRHEKTGVLVIEWDVAEQKPKAAKPKAQAKTRPRKKPAQEPEPTEAPVVELEPETPAELDVEVPAVDLESGQPDLFSDD
jgi:hypothetical protein